MKISRGPTRAFAGLSLLSLVTAVAAMVSGCAGTAMTQRLDRGRLYTGWVRFSGEFTLYADPKSFANAATSRCVSGALPLEQQKEAAAKFNGQRVFVRAKAVPWVLPDERALTLNHGGSPITNWCGGKEVLFATEMVLDKSALRSESATAR